jgi:hypothetical protein
MRKIRIRDGKNSDPGWKKFGSGIRNTVIPDALDPLVVSVQLCVEFMEVGDGSEYDARPVVGLAIQLLPIRVHIKA